MLRWLYKIADRLRQSARRRQWPADKALGRLGEDTIHRWLERQGMIVVARNFAPPGGKSEADLIAWDGDELAVVEVKTRSSAAFGAPERNIDRKKQLNMVSAGEYYARRAEIPLENVRFDVASVVLADGVAKIEYFKAAVRPGKARGHTH